MTATLTAPAAPMVAATQVDGLAARRDAFAAMDGDVRALLRHRLLGGGFSLLPPVVELTVYDRVLARTPATGGHWTVAQRTPVLLLHRVDCYTISLEFDAHQRPVRFHIEGAAATVSTGATLEALDMALIAARRAGPQTAWAPSFVPGLSL